MKAVTMKVNGNSVTADVEPRLHLADFLRNDCHLTGTHLGCEHGVCGACTVIKDGRPVRSCLTYTVSCEAAEIATIESFDDDPVMTHLRAAFSAEHALQCGYCTPGMLVSSRDIVLRHAGRDISDRDIRRELSGNLCRCTGYDGIVRAIKRVLARPEYASGPILATSGSAPQKIDMLGRGTIPLDDGHDDAASGTATSSQATDRGREIASSFILRHAPDTVWQALKDIRLVVACLPGAELNEVRDDGWVEGCFHIKLGPISARITGEGTVAYDDAQQRGYLEGQGKDNTSDSRARGDLMFRVEPDDAGRTRLQVSLTFELTGTLAQFSRGGLVEDIVRSLIEQFRVNLDAHLSGKRAPTATALNPLSLLMMALRRRFGAWLGRR